MHKGSKKRFLKVYYGHHGSSYKKHPVIHLSGKYLQQLGFEIGDCVEVTGSEGAITITNTRALKLGETEAGSAGAQPVRDTLA